MNEEVLMREFGRFGPIASVKVRRCRHGPAWLLLLLRLPATVCPCYCL